MQTTFFVAESFRERKNEVSILSPKKAYNICKLTIICFISIYMYMYNCECWWQSLTHSCMYFLVADMGQLQIYNVMYMSSTTVSPY